MGESGDPGCFVRARVVADLAVAEAVDVDAVPLDVAPAGGDAENGALLCAAHDHAHHDLIALAEDVVDGDVRVGERGDHAGEQPGDVGAARDRAHGAAGPLHGGVQVLGGVVAVVLVDDVLKECLYQPLVRPYARSATPRLRGRLGAVSGGCRRRVRGDAGDSQAGGGQGRGDGNALQLPHDKLLGARCLEP